MGNRLMNEYDLRIIVLVGGHDFRRCPIESRLPRALWPVPVGCALEKLLWHLRSNWEGSIVLCCNGDTLHIQDALKNIDYQNVEFLKEELPVGTAGCIRDAAGSEPDEILLVFTASMVCPPEINLLVEAHIAGKSDMTVMFNPPEINGSLLGTSAGIYVCNKSVLDYIPKQGYCDIKESLIPEMLRARKTVHAATLPNNVYYFRNRQGYLTALAGYLCESQKIDGNIKLCKKDDSKKIWQGANVRLEKDVKIYGPVLFMDGAQIEQGTIIFGPTIVGRNVGIGKDSLVIESALWDGAQIGSNCEIRETVVDYNAIISTNTIVHEEAVVSEPDGRLKRSLKRFSNHVAENMSRCLRVSETKSSGAKMHGLKFEPWFASLVLATVFLWSYKPNIVDLWMRLSLSDEYSSGLLVPLITVYVLWIRRQMFAGCPLMPCMWGAIALIVAQVIRLCGLFYMYDSLERFSIVLSVAALVLLLLGWQLFRKVWAILLFLCLMLPWPNRIQSAVSLPLQQWATSSAVFCLELLGYDVIRQGNIIEIGNTSVEVAWACNGLRMVMAFFVITGMVVLIIKRTWWEKLIILASSLPVALLCNTVRLTVTAIAFTILTGEHWEKIFHDFGGYAMMPLALATIVGEFWLLSKLTLVPREQKAMIITRRKT